MNMLLAVAAGGALGALSRYWLFGRVAGLVGNTFPWATLTANVLGCFLLGVIIEVSALVWTPSPELRSFLIVGLLGAFTTFSTFSVEVYLMAERGQWEMAALYVVGSVVLSIGGLFAGLHLFRVILT